MFGVAHTILMLISINFVQIADQLDKERERHRRPWFMVDPEGPLRHAWWVKSL